MKDHRPSHLKPWEPEPIGQHFSLDPETGDVLRHTVWRDGASGMTLKETTRPTPRNQPKETPT